MTKGNLRLASSRAVNGTVPPKRVPNAELRTREYLDEFEVERLMRAAKANRNGQRDATMILIAFRHGLRAAEIVDLRWDQVDLGRNACLHVRRIKNGMPSVHPLQGDEMRALRELKRISGLVVRVRVGAGRAVHAGGLRQDGGQIGPRGHVQVRCASAYASTCLRLRTGEPGSRHTGIASVPRPQKYSSYGAIYGTVANAFQRLLESLGQQDRKVCLDQCRFWR